MATPAAAGQPQPATPPTRSMSRTIWVIVALATGLAVFFMPRPAGISPEGQTGLAILVWMIVMWLGEPIDSSLTALVGMTLFALLKAAKFGQAFAGFANDTTWFWMSALVIGAALMSTGAARRIGLIIIGMVGTNYSRLVVSLAIFGFLLTFATPTATARVAIMGPLVIGIIQALKLEPFSRGATGLMFTTFATQFTSVMIVNASGASAVAWQVWNDRIGPMSWGQYALYYLPQGIIIEVVVVALILLFWRPAERISLTSEYLRAELQKLGNVSVAEMKALILTGLAILLWIFSKQVGLTPTLVALIIAILLLLPGIGVIDFRNLSKHVNLSLLFYIAAALSLASLIPLLKLDTWLGNLLLGGVGLADTSPFWTMVISPLVFMVARFASLGTGYSAIFTPIALGFAKTAAADPFWLFTAMNTAVVTIILPYQMGNTLIMYGYGYFKLREFIKYCLIFDVVLIFGIDLLLIPIWRALGVG